MRLDAAPKDFQRLVYRLGRMAHESELIQARQESELQRSMGMLRPFGKLKRMTAG
jgi:hypothetical protein